MLLTMIILLRFEKALVYFAAGKRTNAAKSRKLLSVTNDFVI